MNSRRSLVFVLIVAIAGSALPAYAEWETDGNWVCNRVNDQEQIEVIPDGTGGVIMVWKDPRGSVSWPDIYAQRFNNMGQPVWDANGVAVCAANNIQEYPRIASDGSGGAIIAWADNRYTSGRDVYAQRIDAAGAVQWDAGGVVVCLEVGWQNDARVISDGAGGAIISWGDRRSGNTDIYAQRLNASGTAQWTANGEVVCSAASDQVEHDIATDEAGGAIIVWQDWRVFSDIYAQRISASGDTLWTGDGVLVCYPSYVAYPKVVSDGKHGAIIAWEDNRNSRDIWVQRLGADGSPMWTVDGLAMCPSTEVYAMEMRLAPDGEGGALMALADNRNDQYTGYDIRVQKVDSLGTMVWGGDGVSACSDSSDQFWPDLVADGSGGAIVTWEDSRSVATDIDVMAQRITAAGVAAWTHNGISISSATGIQRQGRIATDGGPGAYISWTDERGTSKDVFVTHVNQDGLVPTLLAGFSTSITDNAITVKWRLSEADEQLVHRLFRAEDGGEFEELAASLTMRDLEYELVDTNVAPGASYRYRVYANDTDGIKLLFTTESLTVAPVTLALEQNYPNPFNPGTTISFTVPETGLATLKIFDVSGRHVATLVDKLFTAGTKQTYWNGMDDKGNRVSSGLYFYQLSVAKRTLTKKMILLK